MAPAADILVPDAAAQAVPSGKAAAALPDNMSFEDMMSRFKSQSEEKMADLDHETNNRRGGGYAPRSRGGRR